jgi:hypothetical protein
VQVAGDQPAPSVAAVRSRLPAPAARATPLDVYYVVCDRHWATLGPRHMNPDDEDFGAEALLLLRALKPEFVLVTGGDRPSWLPRGATIIEW